MSDTILVTYSVTKYQKEVIDAAVEMITTTMAAGAASNGEGTWVNREALDYHARKALLHVVSMWQGQMLYAREREEPKLLHLFNAVTRLCMAHANSKRKPVFVADVPE